MVNDLATDQLPDQSPVILHDIVTVMVINIVTARLGKPFRIPRETRIYNINQSKFSAAPPVGQFSVGVNRQYTQEQEIALMEAVTWHCVKHSKSFPVIQMFVSSCMSHTASHTPTHEKPNFYTHICIDAFAGLSLDAKRNLYKVFVSNLEPFGIPKDHVKILLREIAKENWGIREGQTGCDIELGFEVDV